MEKSAQTPALRFSGFTDPWEQRKLDSLCDVFTDGDWIEAKDQSDSGVRLVQTGNVGTTQYLDKEINKKWISEETFERLHCEEIFAGDILISRLPEPAGRACIMPDLGTRMITAVDCTIVRTSKEVDSKYLVQYLSTSMYFKVVNLLLGGGTRQRISRSNLSKIDIPIPPSLDEQKKIGKFFESIDNLITLQQRKVEKLINVKKSMLENMFPQENESVPKIRFSGFIAPWEQRKLSEVLTYYSDPVEIPHTGYERLGIRSHAKGTFHSYVPAGHELQTAQMHRVAADKFIVNITFGWEHAVAVTDDNDAGKLVSHRFPQFSLSKELDPKFLQYIILDEKFRHHLWLSSPGGAGRNRVLNINEMLQYIIFLPSIPEQKLIASYLINLDNLITLHQQKLEKLKNIKKSMLEKMFV